MTIDVKNCQRCDRDHEITIKSLTNPIDALSPNYWGMCPNLNEPILLKITES